MHSNSRPRAGGSVRKVLYYVMKFTALGTLTVFTNACSPKRTKYKPFSSTHIINTCRRCRKSWCKKSYFEQCDDVSRVSPQMCNVLLLDVSLMSWDTTDCASNAHTQQKNEFKDNHRHTHTHRHSLSLPLSLASSNTHAFASWLLLWGFGLKAFLSHLLGAHMSIKAVLSLTRLEPSLNLGLSNDDHRPNNHL